MGNDNDHGGYTRSDFENDKEVFGYGSSGKRPKGGCAIAFLLLSLAPLLAAYSLWA